MVAVLDEIALVVTDVTAGGREFTVIDTVFADAVIPATLRATAPTV
jgi:hypothetical protein